MQTQDHRAQFKVQEEANYAEVNEGMRRRDQVCLLINHEYDGCDNANLRGKRRLHDLHSVRCPVPSEESLVNFQERGAVAFYHSDDDHDQISARVYFCSMMDSVVNLFGTSYFLGKRQGQLNGQQFAELVNYVKRRIEDEVPAK